MGAKRRAVRGGERKSALSLFPPQSKPSLDHERVLRGFGYPCVAGVDEAGRGAWAGPVMAAAVILPLEPDPAAALCAVNDSKKLSPVQRADCRALIEQIASAFAIGSASAQEIDELGIVGATRLAMLRAIDALPIKPDALIIDAVRLPGVAIHQRVFNFADSISLSVAAASILAKTERDALMQRLELTHPGYGFGVHKGYGTRKHQEALRALGVSTVHRRSFAPIKNLPGLGDLGGF